VPGSTAVTVVIYAYLPPGKKFMIKIPDVLRIGVEQWYA
jgi:hypothetical protein